MSEQEPLARLNIGNGETFEARRDTAELWTFLGRAAIYNHVYCFETIDNEVQQSFYIFDFVDGYEELVAYMLANEYPMHLFQREPLRSDIEAYERAALRDLDNTPDWLPPIE